MISETRIIELAVKSNKKCNSTGNKYESNTVNKAWLLEFANALQTEWIKSLGEPLAYMLRNEYNEFRLEPDDNFNYLRLPVEVLTKLYALPNEEVNSVAIDLIDKAGE